MHVRRYLVLVFALCCTIAASAQPTYTTANLPSPGMSILWSEADTIGVQPGPAGAGVTWDFSSLVLTGNTNTLKYAEPSASPYAAEYPSATVAEESDTAWSYFTLANGRWTRLGESSEAFQSGQWEDGLDFAKVPWAFEESYDDQARHQFTSGIATTYRNGTITATYDAYGTLILPQGTFTNVLRLHYFQSIRDSATIPAGPTTITTLITTDIEAWVWFQEGNDEPLLAIDTAWITIVNGPPINQTREFRTPHVRVTQQQPGGGGGTDPDPPTLVQPADASQIAGTSVQLEWSGSSAPATTQLQIALDDAFSSTTVDETVAANSFIADALELGRTYFWRARTITPGIVKHHDDQPQAESAWSPVRSFTMIPEAPTLLTPANNGTVTGTPTWTWEWTPTTGKSRIQVAATSSFESPAIDASVNGDRYEGTVGEGQWYWRVRCLASNDVPGEWSEPWSFTVGPTSVIELSSTDITIGPNPSSGRVYLSGADLARFTTIDVIDVVGSRTNQSVLAPGTNRATIDLQASGSFRVVLTGPQGVLTIPVVILP